MRRVLSALLPLALGIFISSSDATQAQEGNDNKAICDIEETCLTLTICDDDTGELDADGDLIALTDPSGMVVKKKATRKAAKKKATKKARKKARKKKATRKKAQNFHFNTRKGDSISEVLTEEELTILLAELETGYFDGISLCPACCGDGVLEAPEVCEPILPETCNTDSVCSEDCSECLSIPQ